MARFISRIVLIVLSLTIVLISLQGIAVKAAERDLTVEADARVQADHADTNYGTQRRLTVDGTPRIETYLRFTIPDGTSVAQAQLKLWTTSGAGVLPSVALADNKWSEQSITWNTRPARIGDPITTRGGASAGQWITFDLSKLIKQGGTYTLVLAQSKSDCLSFESREGSHAAKLTLITGASISNATSQPTTPAQPSPTPAQPTATAVVTPTSAPVPSDPAPSSPNDPPSPSGKTYYVAKTGDNSNGRSWDSAWNDVDNISWSQIKPGDLILIKAGTYRGRLAIGANGTASAPIWIRASGGVVQLVGGRDTPLPYCDQENYVQHGDNGSPGINIDNHSNIVIDGAQWGGIKISGWNYGLTIKDGAHDITVRYVEVFDNGIIEKSGNKYRPRMHGTTIDSSTHDITFERVQYHDNGSDAFHSYGGTNNFTLRESWLYNTRKGPDGDVFNHCTHPDGIQYSDANGVSGVLVEQTIMGPGIYHGILASGSRIEDVVFRDVLIYDALTSTIATRSGGSKGWVIDHVTSVQSDDSALNIEISAGSNHTIKNSIVIGGSYNLVVSGTALDNNYYDDVKGKSIGEQRSVSFRNASNGDYTPQTNVNGAGSRLTSVASLLAR